MGRIPSLTICGHHGVRCFLELYSASDGQLFHTMGVGGFCFSATRLQRWGTGSPVLAKQSQQLERKPHPCLATGNEASSQGPNLA